MNDLTDTIVEVEGKLELLGDEEVMSKAELMGAGVNENTDGKKSSNRPKDGKYRIIGEKGRFQRMCFRYDENWEPEAAFNCK